MCLSRGIRFCWNPQDLIFLPSNSIFRPICANFLGAKIDNKHKNCLDDPFYIIFIAKPIENMEKLRVNKKYFWKDRRNSKWWILLFLNAEIVKVQPLLCKDLDLDGVSLTLETLWIYIRANTLTITRGMLVLLVVHLKFEKLDCLDFPPAFLPLPADTATQRLYKKPSIETFQSTSLISQFKN